YRPGNSNHPINRIVLRGQDVTLNVSAVGDSPLSFQWYTNNAPIPDATNSILHLSNIQLVDAGDYWVRVSNPYGTTNSNPATVQVRAPELAVQPPATNSIGCSSVSFMARWTNEPPSSYQWFIAGTPVPNATNAS